MVYSCTPEMDEPPTHVFSPHVSRGDADQQHAQPVNTITVLLDFVTCERRSFTVQNFSVYIKPKRVSYTATSPAMLARTLFADGRKGGQRQGASRKRLAPAPERWPSPQPARRSEVFMTRPARDGNCSESCCMRTPLDATGAHLWSTVFARFRYSRSFVQQRHRPVYRNF